MPPSTASRTIADIMAALNPFEGSFYREALQVSRLTREMFCLMEGRHVHPSTLTPGGVGTVASVQLFTDYLTRLARYADFMKRCVPMHDDLFDFVYEAMPGYEEVGLRRTQLICGGSWQDPAWCDFEYARMGEWGRHMFVTPGIVIDDELVTTDLVEINLGMRILVDSSFYDGWDSHEQFVTHDPLGNAVDPNHPWNQHTLPRPQGRDFDDKYSWVVAPRWFDGTEHHALDTGGGALARLWVTAKAGLVDFGYVRATGDAVEINLPATAQPPRDHVRVAGAEVVQHHRARPGPYLLPGLRRGGRLPLRRTGAGRTPSRQRRHLDALRRARRGHRLRVHRSGAGRAVASPRDPRGPHRQLPPVPADLVERLAARPVRHAAVPTRMPWRARHCSRRVGATTSRASTSCGLCAASTRVCRVASTCTPAGDGCSRAITLPRCSRTRDRSSDGRGIRRRARRRCSTRSRRVGPSTPTWFGPASPRWSTGSGRPRSTCSTWSTSVRR